MELALKLFLVVLATELINFFGKAILIDLVRPPAAVPPQLLPPAALPPAIDQQLSSASRPARQAFGIYQTVVQGPALRANRALKKDTLAAKLELARTSSQDEFAKWAKLRRKLDKLVAELEKSSACRPLFSLGCWPAPGRSSC